MNAPATLTPAQVLPETTFVVPLGDEIVMLPCTYPNTTVAGTSYSQLRSVPAVSVSVLTVVVYRECPGSFETSTSSDVEDTCEYPCPVPIYSTAQYTIMKGAASSVAYSPPRGWQL